MSLKVMSSAIINAPSASFESWGFRAGAKEEGTCAISGVKLSTENDVKTGEGIRLLRRALF